jgi:hypothetical protein
MLPSGRFLMLRIGFYALWFASPLMQCGVMRRILVRRLFQDYPLFFSYVVAHILSFVSLFYFYHYCSENAYKQAYMGWDVIDAVLKFAVIGELFARVFSSYKSVHRLGTTIVRITSVVLVLSAVLVSALSDVADSNSWLSKFFALERSAEIVQTGLVLLLFALCYALGLRWKQPTWSIASGLCIITGVYLVAFTLRAELGNSYDQILSLISSAGYDLGVLTWLLTLYPQRSSVRPAASPPVPTWDVASWNRALMELLRR